MVVVFLVAALAALGGAALLVNITERKQEGRNPFFRVVELTDETDDPEIWGKNFPMQYDGYKHTTDQVRTRFGGSEAVPRTPTQVDPRSVVAPIAAGRRSPIEDHVGGLCVCARLPRRARPRLHA
jgi:nitrite reductase (cytochrome c-552)